jgi:hypothetical protein
MIRPLIAAAVVLPLLVPAAPVLAAGKVPTKVGQCVATTIKLKGSRLEGVPDSGDSLIYGNGIFGVSYEAVPAMHSARAGDKIRLCLTSLPKDCPKGDDRGKTYRATDLRTKKSWELPDSEHMCGGA